MCYNESIPEARASKILAKEEGRTMKKILCILVLILAVACVLSACNQSSSPNVETTSTTHKETTTESTTPEETTPEEETKHLWSDWITIKDAKCEEKGLLQRYCTECYYTESKPIDVLGHTEVIDAAVAPTCTQVGFSEGKHCSVCNKVVIAQQSIDALGHTEVIDAAIAPTCTQVGFSEGKHCSACGEILIAQKIIPENGHNYVATFVAPTAKEDGVTKHTCSNCGDFYFTDVTPIDFTVTEGNRFMVGYTGEQGENLVIPAVFQEDGIWYRVTSIGDGAFSSCTSLTSVTIPDSVTSIGKDAFFFCLFLTSVTIGDSVTSIGCYAFNYCTSLTSILVDNDNTAYQSIDGNLYSKDGNMLIAYAIGKIEKSFTIPDSVTSIGDYAFLGCTSLTSVTIGDSVKSIGGSAFWYCTSLTSVTIPDSVKSIGDEAFHYCTSLTSVTIGDSVTSIGDYAFDSCTSLTSVTIGDSVTSIGYGAFYYCKSLTSVTIPDSVTSIDNSAFYYCESLTSVTFANPNGWWVTKDANATSGTAIPADSLSNPATAARYLKDTYIYYYWFRTE